MAECNGCGSCCDPVHLSQTQEELAAMSPDDFVDPDFQPWALALIPIPREEGIERARVSGRGPVGGWAYFYRCPSFDEGTRLCTAHETRPLVCRGYPWYRGVPEPGKSLSRYCAFRADIGQPVEAMPVEWKGIPA